MSCQLLTLIITLYCLSIREMTVRIGMRMHPQTFFHFSSDKVIIAFLDNDSINEGMHIISISEKAKKVKNEGKVRIQNERLVTMVLKELEDSL